jgi:hypothetical protein
MDIPFVDIGGIFIFVGKIAQLFTIRRSSGTVKHWPCFTYTEGVLQLTLSPVISFEFAHLALDPLIWR